MSRADGTLALSDALDIIEFLHTHKCFTPPTDVVGAAISFICIEPVPGEVWEYLPSELYWSENILPRYPPLINPEVLEPLILSRRNLEVFEETYPPVAGRAGGKVNISWADVWDTHVLTVAGRKVLQLFYLKRHCLKFENLPVISLALMDQYSHNSHLLQSFIVSNSEVLLQPLKSYTKWLKSLHVGIRTTATFPGLRERFSSEEQRCLYGVDSTVGRSELLSPDHANELLMRLQDPTLRADRKSVV